MRCDQCKFWVVGEQWAGGQPERNAHEDDYLGTCHRHAPSPTKGEFEHRLLNALILMIPDDVEDEGLFKNWEECVESTSPTWPSTSATDWCGEFAEKITPLGMMGEDDR